MSLSGSFALIASIPHIPQGLAYCSLSLRRSVRVILIIALWICLAQRLAAGAAVDFRQAADNDAGFGLGNTHWVSSIIQDNNSAYYESMSVMQRMLFTGLPPTSRRLPCRPTHLSARMVPPRPKLRPMRPATDRAPSEFSAMPLLAMRLY